ncbi:hypothetical protein BD413DRAFT_268912 [Trametes elegans]|nr:hypothetical protein BD413DRAFT_268912 [Trametes elegans]
MTLATNVASQHSALPLEFRKRTSSVLARLVFPPLALQILTLAPEPLRAPGCHAPAADLEYTFPKERLTSQTRMPKLTSRPGSSDTAWSLVRDSRDATPTITPILRSFREEKPFDTAGALQPVQVTVSEHWDNEARGSGALVPSPHCPTDKGASRIPDGGARRRQGQDGFLSRASAHTRSGTLSRFSSSRRASALDQGPKRPLRLHVPRYGH